MTKNYFLGILTVFLLYTPSASSQTGPGGVGGSSNIPLWLTADQEVFGLDQSLVPFLQVNDEPIGRWGNLYGTNYLEQTDEEMRPDWVCGQLNGYPVVSFNGVDQNLAMTLCNPCTNPEATTIVVGKYDKQVFAGNAKDEYLISFGSSSNDLYGIRRVRSGQKTVDQTVSGSLFSSGPDCETPNTFRVYSQQITGNPSLPNQYLWVDGDLIAVEASPQIPYTGSSQRTVTLGNHLIIANQEGMSGDIAEVIIYDHAINTTQRTIVENYLAAKYNLPILNDKYAFDEQFGYEVAGIGQEVGPTDKHEQATGTGIVTISDPSNLSDGDYLFWGHDHAGFELWQTDIPVSGARLAQVWRVDKTGNLGTVTVAFDLSAVTSIPVSNRPFVQLMIHPNGHFANSSGISGSYDPVTQILTFSGVALADGDHFTLLDHNYQPVGDDFEPLAYFTFSPCDKDQNTPFPVEHDWYGNFNGHPYQLSSPADIEQNSSSCVNNVLENYMPVNQNTDTRLMGFNPAPQWKEHQVAFIDMSGSDHMSMEFLFRMDKDLVSQNMEIFSRAGQGHRSFQIRMAPTGWDIYAQVRVDQTTPLAGDCLPFSGGAACSQEYHSYRLIIPFSGIGRQSYSYIADHEWHHLALTLDNEKGELKFYLDGQSPEGFSSRNKCVSKASQGNDGGYFINRFAPNPNNILFGDLDEIAFYDKTLPPTMVQQHYEDIFTWDRHYTFNHETDYNALQTPEPVSGTFSSEAVAMPGKTAVDQIKEYPFPRYKPEHHLNPNFPWIDNRFLGNFPHVPLLDAVSNCRIIMEELGDHWNHYLLYNNMKGFATKDAANPELFIGQGFNNSFVELANRRTDLPIAAITYWNQGNPSHMNSSLPSKPFILDQGLSTFHYISDGAGGFVKLGSKNALSPIIPHNETKIDGRNHRFYFENAYNYLSRPFDMINENGENNHFLMACKYSHYANEPGVLANICSTSFTVAPTLVGNNGCAHNDIPALNELYPQGCTISGTNTQVPAHWREYTSIKRTDLRKAFRDEFMSMSQHANTSFTWYQVDGTRGFSWPYFEVAKTIGSPIASGNSSSYYYGTPDFYPEHPNRWESSAGEIHGLDWIERTRTVELADGQKLFSPFLGAGWSEDPNFNVQPGQWLGLCKVLGMYGAEFYYAGFYSGVDSKVKTDQNGDPIVNADCSVQAEPIFPSPDTWVWQLAIPSYAQAITSRFEDILVDGDLLQNGSEYIFDIPSGTLLDRVVARKLGPNTPKYAITGTIQSFSNYVGPDADPEVAEACIKLDQTDDMIFTTRRQGSTYIYDKTLQENPHVLFYQLDGWHENKHPDYWSNDFSYEGEVYDKINQTPGAIPSNSKYFSRASRMIDNQGVEKVIPVQSSAPLDLRDGHYVSYLSFPWNQNYPADFQSWTTADYVEDRPYVDYRFFPRNEGLQGAYNYFYYINARLNGVVQAPLTTGFNIMVIKVSDGTVVHNSEINCIQSNTWTWYANTSCQLNGLENEEYILRLLPHNNLIEINEILVDFNNDNIPSGVMACSQGNVAEPQFEIRGESLCSGEPVQFINQSTWVGCGNYSYAWSFGDQNYSNLENPTHAYQPGNYTVTLTVTNLNTQQSQVISKPITIFSSPVANPTGGTTICEGKSVSLDAGESGGLAPYTFLWNETTAIPNPADITSKTPTVKPNYREDGQSTIIPTNFTVVVTDAVGCTATGTVPVVVSQSQSIVVDIVDDQDAAFGSVSQCGNGATLRIHYPSWGTAAYNYDWITGDLSLLSSASGQLNANMTPTKIAIGNSSSQYRASDYYEVVVTDNDGCTAKGGAYLEVTQDLNNTNCRRGFFEEESEEEDGVNSFNVFPNPTRGDITVVADQPIRNVSVFSLQNQLMFQRNGGEQLSLNLDMSSLANGVYFLVIEGNRQQSVKKVIIQ